LRYVDHVDERGEALYKEIRKMGLEGMVAKKLDSPYRGGRSHRWVKVRAETTSDFVIVGFTQPKQSRGGFGALHLATYKGPELVYTGRVGTGFSEQQLTEIRADLERLRLPRPPCSGDPPSGSVHIWVEPRLVAEVRFLELTQTGQLRHPVFVRLRDDKRPEECGREDPIPEQAPEEPVQDLDEKPSVAVTRAAKVFWPSEGYTKGDLDAYYQAVSPWLLPLLKDRPVVLDRYPDGIQGKSFFQKNAPEFVPEWIVTEAIWSEEEGDGEQARYFCCNDEQSLRYLVNLGAIPLHIWHSRLASLQAPDWCVLDLDAKEAPFPFVIRAAREIRRPSACLSKPLSTGSPTDDRGGSISTSCRMDTAS
jgi:bifunctional non-homologous end joining protein LigD